MIANQENTAQQVKVKRKGKQASSHAGEIVTQGGKGAGKQGAEQGERADNCSLTRKQAAVLGVIMNPAHHGKTNAEKAKLAGVSERLLYLTLQDPEVEAQRQQMVKRMVIQGVAPAVDAMLKTAAVPGRDSFQDRRLLFGMSGDYIEKKQQDVTLNGQMLVGVVNVSLDQL